MSKNKKVDEENVMKLYKAYKVEINPTKEQQIKINKTIGTCRFLQNLYIEHRNKYYKKYSKILTVNQFDQWYRKEFIPNNKEYSWILDVSSKSRKQALNDINQAYINFYKKRARLPKFRKKHDQKGSMYFVRTNKNYIIDCDRHRIKIPTLGFVKLKEKGYLPTNKPIISGRITRKADRYYVSVTVEFNFKSKPEISNKGLGIDLGIKKLAVCSTGDVYSNINDSNKIKRIEKQLRKQQRNLSRKLVKNKEVKSATCKNIDKNILKIQKLHLRLSNIRTDYENQVINSILKLRPKYITMEKLNIKGMLKNKYLSKSIQSQRWYSFKNKLTTKAKERGIEIREVSSWYPSSKTCSGCQSIKTNLKLTDRVYFCENCQLTIDRDLNAAINLENALEYQVI